MCDQIQLPFIDPLRVDSGQTCVQYRSLDLDLVTLYANMSKMPRKCRKCRKCQKCQKFAENCSLIPKNNFLDSGLAAVCVQVVTGAFGPDENLPAAVGEATAKSGSCGRA
jgi:hypothetical protein